MLGVGITNAIVTARSMLDRNFKAQNPPQNPLQTSAAYASYLGLSANLRYQVGFSIQTFLLYTGLM